MRARARFKTRHGKSRIMEVNPDREWLMNAVCAAESGDGPAQKELAEIPGRKLEEIGMEPLETLAEKGNSWAEFLVGRVLDGRRETGGNAEPAIAAYTDSAGKGNPYSMAALAEHYEKGDGRTKSIYNAYLLHRKAAEKGLSSSEKWLEKNGAKAEEIGRLADGAGRGDPESMYRLALEHDRGTYVEYSPEKTMALLMEAADMGHEDAALCAAERFIGGIGIPEHRELGICMLAALAENGSEKAQNRIRSMTPYDMAECDGNSLRNMAAGGSAWAADIVSMICGKDRA